jgi:hypothetical protein
MLVSLFSTEMPESKEIKDVLNEKFISKDKFAEDIEHLVLTTEMNYIDAIVEYCSRNNIEIESASKLISKPLKEKIRFEATELNFLKKTSRARLPL